MTDRIVGKYKGNEPGPLLVITAAMHGNEPAGVKALDLLFKMLEVEPITNPDFIYRGEIIGLLGNVQAFHQQKRYITKDINRSWDPKFINYLKESNKSSLQSEDLEIRDLLDIIDAEISAVEPDKIYLLDLHTTSSEGGIFCIATNQAESIRLAYDIHAPVVLGLLEGIQHTTLHYFCRENIGLPTTAIAFEGGYHDDPQSINRCIAAIINFMRAAGVINPEHVENHHDRILLDYAEKLPKVIEVKYKFHVADNKSWYMKPGYKNFRKVSKGEILATYQGRSVHAPMDGLILMPLYQTQGHDGFFIASEWNYSKENF